MILHVAAREHARDVGPCTVMSDEITRLISVDLPGEQLRARGMSDGNEDAIGGCVRLFAGVDVPYPQSGHTFAAEHVDDNPRTAQRFQVMSIPTLLLFKNGETQARIVGARSKSQIMSEFEPLL